MNHLFGGFFWSQHAEMFHGKGYMSAENSRLEPIALCMMWIDWCPSLVSANLECCKTFQSDTLILSLEPLAGLQEWYLMTFCSFEK